jgi:adenylate kinase
VVPFLQKCALYAVGGCVIIILLGPPGAGKGTQADFICQHLNIPKISTGDILRVTANEDTAQGRQLKEIMASGALVDDQLVLSIIAERMRKPDCLNGALFDGFPRNIDQAQSMITAGIHVDYVVELQVSDEEIVQRLAGRRIHPASGRTYHITTNPPKNPDRDDLTNEPLVQRPDDSEDVIRKRLAIYHASTEPLVNWYSAQSESLGIKIIKIKGAKSVDEVKKMIIEQLI